MINKGMIDKGMTELMDSSKHVRNLLLLITIGLLIGACSQAPKGPAAEQQPPPLKSPPGRSQPPPTPVALRSEHPQEYVVVPGDTLWSISDRFLRDPWHWQEIWRRNPQISNPDLIYPGDVVELYYENGQPRLQVSSRSGTQGIIKLSPQIRVESLSQPIPPLPRSAIEQFLERSQVMTEDEWASAPYIVGGADDNLIFGSFTRVYARGADFDQSLYQVFRPGVEYRDPSTQEPLGFDLVYVGEAILEENGDPATLQLNSTVREGRVGDRLLEVETDQDMVLQFMPHPAPLDTEGQIVAAQDGGFLIGQYQSVVLNLGEWDGIEPGHVLAIHNLGRAVEDRMAGGEVVLPDTPAGLLMVYKVFDRTSYGLVTEATRAIRPHDRVTDP